jgi:methionyl-tRNA formyltransferase
VRAVFMGTPEFAVPSMRALAGSHEVAAVYTRPDAVSGRGGKTRPSAVKVAARELGIEVFEPKTLRDAEALAALRNLNADIITVAAYGLILPLAALEAAPLGAINVHASLLPRWRGAAPIQRAILAGDDRTGVSIMRMEEGLDTGPYCLQVSTEIGEAGAVELTDRLARLGAQALLDALPTIADGTALWSAQDESAVTYADKISKDDVAIGPELTQAELLRRIRASSPAAPSRAVLGTRGATIMRACSSDMSLTPGAIASGKFGLVLGAKGGAIEVVELKPDGKAAMDAVAWARGQRDLDGAMWGGTR